MEKEFIPYELALELKELGFDEPCLIKDDEHGEDCVVYYVHDNGKPTYRQAFKWFREKYGLYYDCLKYFDEKYRFSTYSKNIDDFFQSESFETYEEAELECLKKLIEIVKENGKSENS